MKEPAARTALLADPRFLDHVTPDEHPERTARMRVLLELADELRAEERILRIAPRAATDEELLSVHSEAHLKIVAATSGKAYSMLDPDTFTSAKSFETAQLAAGGCIELVDAVADGRARNAIAFVRPPGHHAERDRPMGFCLFNNVAVAAAHLRNRGLSRVAIVDWDVHHGNGTQQIFEEEPTVFFASMHQFPFYPGTGAAWEKGRGPGRGFTLNVPMTEGDGDTEWIGALTEIVVPALETFAPEFLLVSAGFDAHANDPLGGMRVTEAGFAAMARTLLDFARRHCKGRFAAFLEGGYDLTALKESARAVAAELLVASSSHKENTS